MKILTSVLLSILPCMAAAQAAPQAQSKYTGSISYTGIYTYQNFNHDSIYGATSQNLAGWGITPEINFTRHFGFQGDFVTSYSTDSIPSLTQFTVAAGPRYTMNPYWKGTPFFFGEAGETRISYGNFGGNQHPAVDWEPTASAGIGFDVNLTPRFGLQFVPAEWMGQRLDYNGEWQNNFMARFGFVFNFRRP
jgi:opacity protein-like surface antigen